MLLLRSLVDLQLVLGLSRPRSARPIRRVVPMASGRLVRSTSERRGRLRRLRECARAIVERRCLVPGAARFPRQSVAQLRTKLDVRFAPSRLESSANVRASGETVAQRRRVA